MTRFVEDRYLDTHQSTIGVDFKTVVCLIEGKLVKLHIWDTAGQERFAQVTSHYYRGADAAILVYDITNASSFDHLETWTEAVISANPLARSPNHSDAHAHVDADCSNDYSNSSVLFMLVGNKVHTLTISQSSIKPSASHSSIHSFIYSSVSICICCFLLG